MIRVKNLSNPKLSIWILRIGLAFVFGYAAVMSLVHPLQWAGYLPSFATNFVGADTAVRLLAIYELLLAAWLLTGTYLKYCAALCALTLAGIVAFNTGNLLITFRDVGLACMAVALVFAE
ncbi:MAG TPA: hypothetical protein VLH84_00495 [Patescibacteria group bacterium]|nr:hypothetical protein [Patescibacteria group bacterium]